MNTNKDYQAEWALQQPMVIGKNLDRGGSNIEGVYPDPFKKGKLVYPDYRERLRCFDPLREEAMIARVTPDLARTGYAVIGTRRYDRYQTWDASGEYLDPLQRRKLYLQFQKEGEEVQEVAMELLTGISSSGQDLNGNQVYSDADYQISFEGPGVFSFDPATGWKFAPPLRRA